MAGEPWELAGAAAAAIAERTGVERHDVALVLGSGWVGALEALGSTVAEIPAVDLPGFAPPGVAGHSPLVRSLRTPSDRALLVVPRVHAYEGHTPGEVVHGIRAAIVGGCGSVLLTNAAGGLRDDLRVGQAVMVSDHLNLTGQSPLSGPAVPGRLAPERFVDLTDAWSPRLRGLARAVDGSLVEGVYAGLPGPHYETPAEIRMLRSFGADLVGMSTVFEVIAARHLGAEVFGLSLVTNLAAGLGPVELAHQGVLEEGAAAAAALGGVLAAVAAGA